MKKEENFPFKFESLSHFHRVLGLQKPVHPLISVIDNMDENLVHNCNLPSPFMLNFYKIAYKPNLRGKLKYGQSFYNFEEGGLMFASPNQVAASLDDNGDHSGYTLFIHPDFFFDLSISKEN